MKTKICNKCNKEKNIKGFSKNKSRKDGLNYWCKNCMEDYSKKYWIINKEKIITNQNKYVQNHKKETLQYQKKYRENNKIKIKNDNKKYRDKNKEVLRKKSKIHRQINKKHYQEYDKEYRESHIKERKQYEKAHRKQINKKQREYYKNHKEQWNLRAKKYLQNNVNLRIRAYLSGRIRKVLKGNIKSKKTKELIGCSIKELKQYLQKQFKRGMNWNNYGLFGWHIDHIKPCAKFDLSKPKEQQKCFNYRNLQPLWAEENWSKRDKFIK